MDGAKMRRGTRHSTVISLEPSRVIDNTALLRHSSAAKSASDITLRSAGKRGGDHDGEHSRSIRSCAATDLAMPQMHGGRSTRDIEQQFPLPPFTSLDTARGTMHGAAGGSCVWTAEAEARARSSHERRV